jgi:hypothetical protein
MAFGSRGHQRWRWGGVEEATQHLGGHAAVALWSCAWQRRGSVVVRIELQVGRDNLQGFFFK